MAVKAQERADLANELLEQIGQTVGQKANVSSVFGEPIEREGLTVIPVAKAVTGSFQPHMPPPYIAVIVVMTAAIGLAGTLLPTIARLRSRPVDAIGNRE